MEVIDARVVCVKPTLSNLTLNVMPDTDYWFMTGAFDVEGVHPTAVTTKTSNATDQKYVLKNFNCSAPTLNFAEGATYGNASLCLLGIHYAKLLGGIVTEEYDPDLPLGTTMAQLLINATSVSNDYFKTISGNATLKQMDSSAPSWARFGNANMTFDLSACFFNPQPKDYQVSAFAYENSYDSTSYWDNSTGETFFNTLGVEYALNGVTDNLTPSQRGQLTLMPSSNWTANLTSDFHNVSIQSFILDSLTIHSGESTSPTFQLTPFVYPEEAMHRTHADLMTKFLRKTHNPALALQAHWTVLLQMAYYDFSGEYDVHAPAVYGVSVPVIIPFRWTSFAVVMGLLALHSALVIFAVVLFITRTEMSLLGNSWQAVSQVWSTDTATTVHQGAMATDEEMKKSTKESHLAGERMVIAKSAKTGRTEAVSVLRRR